MDSDTTKAAAFRESCELIIDNYLDGLDLLALQERYSVLMAGTEADWLEEVRAIFGGEPDDADADDMAALAGYILEGYRAAIRRVIDEDAVVIGEDR